MSEVIKNIDSYNADLEYGIVTAVLDPPTIDEIKKTNSYNKAVLKTALESKK